MPAKLIDPEKLLQCNLVDCRPRPALPAPASIPQERVSIDYQAKDYDSFLRAMLDQIPARAPGWQQRHEADLGMALVELFAAIADQLSYYQDRVHNEAYLRTASQYESVRRLLALVDFRLDTGSAARVLLAAKTTAAKLVQKGFQIRTRAVSPCEPVVFETSADTIVYPELNEITLAADAPSDAQRITAVLSGIFDAFLSPRSWLLFQSADGAEWAQLASAPVVNTALNTTTLTFAKPLVSNYTMAAGRVNGNGFAATHGESHKQESLGTGPADQTIPLNFAPLTYLDGTSSLRVAVDGEVWTEVDDFIDSTAVDTHYRITRDNDGFVSVHFGNLRQGRAPGAGAAIVLRYRSGIGESGSIAPRSLTAFSDPDAVLTSVVNPLASFGARNPQSLEEAKLLGPKHARTQNRAVTPRDYEDAVLSSSLPVLHAKAYFEWSGSWTTAVVSVGFSDRTPLSSLPDRRKAIEDLLSRKRLAGFDVQIEDARYAPLHISLLVHVKHEYFARQIREQLELALGATGFFAPSRFSFGQPVRLSDLYAAAHKVEGVRYVSVRHFKRLGKRYPESASLGSIEVSPLEIPRCDNDPSHPENGILYIRTCGGKDG